MTVTDTSEKKAAGVKHPEAVRLMLLAWLIAAAGELIHQVLQISTSFLNRDVLIAGMKKALEERDAGMEVSDSLLGVAAGVSIFGSALIFILIIGLLVFMLSRLAVQHKWAGAARRTWFAFSLYFGIRVLFVFMSFPAGSKAPDWLIVADGMVQIAVGVAAVMGLIFSMKEETLEFTGELEQMRALEKELEEKERQKKLEEAKKGKKDKLTSGRRWKKKDSKK